MILSKEVEVLVAGNTAKKYQELGYECKVRDKILVKVEDLPLGSHSMIEAQCEVCNTVVQIRYREYLKINNRGGYFTCSRACGTAKRMKTNNEIYGGNAPMCSPITQAKFKTTMMENHGVEFPFQSPLIMENFKATMMENHGVEFPMQSQIIRDKRDITYIDKYGYICLFNNPIYVAKMQNMFLDMYDCVSPFGDKGIQEKSKQTLFQNYGVYHSTQSSIIQGRMVNTFNNNYGVPHPSQSPLLRKKYNDIDNHPDFIEYIGNAISKFRCEKGHTFEIHCNNFHGRNRDNLPLCTVCHPISEAISINEKVLQDYIKSIYPNNIILNDRIILNGKELDIYLPDLKLAFEFNGLYYHSTEFKSDKYYHLNKTIECEKQGIRLIHIFEDSWKFKNDIIKSQINNWLGVTPIKIGARQTIIKEISTQMARDFLNANHIQGEVKSFCKLGLFHKDVLVSVMCFDKFEGRKLMPDGQYNLTRFANKLNHSVIGGASKLMKHFMKIYPTIRMVSYADRSWSGGGLYETLQFTIDPTVKRSPDYKYIVDGKREHKSNYRKDKLKIDFPQEVADGMTETQIMDMRKIYRIYDCGLIKYEKNI
jgi:hypothetical protein